MKYLVAVIALLACGPCHAQSSVTDAQTALTDEINAVGQAQDQEKKHQDDLAAKQQAEQRAAERRQDAANRRAQALADQQNQLILQDEKTQVQQDQTLANRENDIIDHALKQQDAQTDLIQSQADQNRDLGSGAETLMKDTGAAALNNNSAGTTSY